MSSDTCGTATTEFDVQIQNQPFGIKITRKDNGETMFTIIFFYKILFLHVQL